MKETATPESRRAGDIPSRIVFRHATLDDLDLLLSWRNDPLTRAASLSGHGVTREEHTEWLTRTVSSVNTRLYVAERDDRPVGTVRTDLEGCEYRLSWTVAPAVRGAGIGKRSY